VGTGEDGLHGERDAHTGRSDGHRWITEARSEFRGNTTSGVRPTGSRAMGDGSDLAVVVLASRGWVRDWAGGDLRTIGMRSRRVSETSWTPRWGWRLSQVRSGCASRRSPIAGVGECTRPAVGAAVQQRVED